MKRIIICTILASLALSKISAQDADPGWGIKFSGFVKTDIFYDTRQPSTSCAVREGHFFLYPENVLYDVEGNDVNDNPSFHILNIQSRLRVAISGPDAFGAKTSGVIEGEFFGTTEADINGFRLRHAFVKIDWTKTTLLIGQTWHPMFPDESFPGTISFNTGAPFTPFSRNPQVRVTRKLGILSLSLTAYSQRDFTSSGPDGASNKYLRNSGIPGTNLQFRLPVNSNIIMWAGLDYKKLRPELKTTANYETKSSISGVSYFANLKIKTTPLSISLMGVYGQNACDLVMIGGYGVSEVTDSVTMEKTYTNLNTGNFWIDLTTNGKKFVFGLFSGYSKNLGASEEIHGDVYGRGNNIDHLFRISPRATVTEGRLTFGLEVEHTTAAYGTMESSGKVTNTHSVSNLRLLFSAIYKF